MLSAICRCCGASLTRRVSSNPNQCYECASLDSSALSEDPPTSSLPVTSQIPTEFEQLLGADGPSVLDCFQAVEEAKDLLELDGTALRREILRRP